MEISSFGVHGRVHSSVTRGVEKETLLSIEREESVDRVSVDNVQRDWSSSEFRKRLSNGSSSLNDFGMSTRTNSSSTGIVSTSHRLEEGNVGALLRTHSSASRSILIVMVEIYFRFCR